MLIEIKDVAGLSKPLTRLIEVISAGVGAVSAPYLLKKSAEAQAYQIKTIAGALSIVAESHQLPVNFKDGKIEIWQRPEDNTLSLEPVTEIERMQRRVDYQERKGQFNIEKITLHAADNLSSEKEVPNDSPSEDWITRFFDAAQKISSEEMQLLWGKILAGEIKKPGSYSLKALEFIRNLEKVDADLIESLARFRIESGPRRTIITNCTEEILEKEKINYTTIITLIELGILYPDKLSFTLFEHEKEGYHYFISGNKLLLMTAGASASTLRFENWKYTKTGEELLNLTPLSNCIPYLEKIGTHVARQGYEVHIADFTGEKDGYIKYENKRQIEP